MMRLSPSKNFFHRNALLCARAFADLFHEVSKFCQLGIFFSVLTVFRHQDSEIVAKRAIVCVQQMDSRTFFGRDSKGEMLKTWKHFFFAVCSGFFTAFGKNFVNVEFLHQKSAKLDGKVGVGFAHQDLCHLSGWGFGVQNQGIFHGYLGQENGFLLAKFGQSVAFLRQSARIVLHSLAAFFGLGAEACGARHAAGFSLAYCHQGAK